MTILKTLIEQAEAAGFDKMILTVQPTGNGKANTVLHFAVNQRSSLTMNANDTALLNALSQPLHCNGTSEEIELAFAESLRRMNGLSKIAVDQFRGKTNADDVVASLIAATSAKSANEAKEDNDNVDVSDDSASELVNLKQDVEDSPASPSASETTESLDLADSASTGENPSLF